MRTFYERLVSRRSEEYAVSMIEMLLVLTIISVLMLIITPSLIEGNSKRANDQLIENDLRSAVVAYNLLSEQVGYEIQVGNISSDFAISTTAAHGCSATQACMYIDRNRNNAPDPSEPLVKFNMSGITYITVPNASNANARGWILSARALNSTTPSTYARVNPNPSDPDAPTQRYLYYNRSGVFSNDTPPPTLNPLPSIS